MDDPVTAVDEDVLRRIAGAEGALPSPYSEFGTLVAKVTALRRFLVAVARERARTDYGTVARECGVHTARLGRVLGILGVHEDVHGRPLLPAVVTKAGGEIPDEVYVRIGERRPGFANDVPDDPAARRWTWETQRADAYRWWADGERRREGGSAASA